MTISAPNHSELSPIALFVYNRPEHTRRTVESLAENELAPQSDLFVFADGAKSENAKAAIQQVREYVQAIRGFRSVTIAERERNVGLAASVIGGVTQVCAQFGRAIVVEDDLLTAPNFLGFMNEALEHYKDEVRVFSVSGFNFPINSSEDYPYDAFCSYRSSSWGWGTWQDRWSKAEWSVPDFADFMGHKEQQNLFNRGGDDLTGMLSQQMAGQLDSWSIRWDYVHFKHQALALFPVTSMVYNIGFDGSGVHCKRETLRQRALPAGRTQTYRFPERADVPPHFAAEIKRLHRQSRARKLLRYLRSRLES
jgi:Glycosyl transferase family 2